MARLKDIIYYIILRYVTFRRLGMGRVRLMKLLFLVDYKSFENNGFKITNVKWIKWFFGPFSKEVLDSLDELVYDGYLMIERSDVGKFYSPLSTYKFKLEDDKVKLIDNIIREYGFLPLDELLRRVYSIDLVRKAKLGDMIL